MFKRATAVSDIMLGVVAVVVAVFTAAFGSLLWDATTLANSRGLNSMFASYGYITIEATWLCMVLVGAYQVFRIGMRRRETSADQDYDFIESEG